MEAYIYWWELVWELLPYFVDKHWSATVHQNCDVLHTHFPFSFLPRPSRLHIGMGGGQQHLEDTYPYGVCSVELHSTLSVDAKKAFNRVDWCVLEETLLQLSLGSNSCKKYWLSIVSLTLKFGQTVCYLTLSLPPVGQDRVVSCHHSSTCWWWSILPLREIQTFYTSRRRKTKT